jgi:hypothetical protein
LSALLKIENLAKNHLKMISSETAGSNGPNYGEMVFSYPLSEFCPMAPATSQVVGITKNRKFGKKSFKNNLL